MIFWIDSVENSINTFHIVLSLQYNCLTATTLACFCVLLLRKYYIVYFTLFSISAHVSHIAMVNKTSSSMI